MQDYNGQQLAVGEQVFIAGRITDISDDVITIETLQQAPGVDADEITVDASHVLKDGSVARTPYAEYPKAVAPGVIVGSEAEEDAWRLAPKRAEEARQQYEQAQADKEQAATDRAHQADQSGDAPAEPPAGPPDSAFTGGNMSPTGKRQ